MTLPGEALLLVLFASLLAGLGWMRHRYAPSAASLVTQVCDALPQTQCAQCGYPGCRAYAEAIVQGAPINRCPPGGADTIARLSQLTGREPEPPAADLPPPHDVGVAFIAARDCIGCGFCVPACPVDAIAGARGRLHAIIESRCTGCELCIDPCPVDCISLLDLRGSEIGGRIRRRPPAPELPRTALADGACIQCGLCNPVCPRDLDVQQLWRVARAPEPNAEDARHLDWLAAADCIECGLCDAACPAQLPLAATIGAARHRAEQDGFRKLMAARAAQGEATAEQRELRLVALLAADEDGSDLADEDEIDSLLDAVRDPDGDSRS